MKSMIRQTLMTALCVVGLTGCRDDGSAASTANDEAGTAETTPPSESDGVGSMSTESTADESTVDESTTEASTTDTSTTEASTTEASTSGTDTDGPGCDPAYFGSATFGCGHFF